MESPERHVLQSETLRAGLLLGASASMVLIGIGIEQLPGEWKNLSVVRHSGGPAMLVVLGLYEAIVLAWLLRRRKSGKSLPKWFRVVNIILETSMPGIGLYLISQRLGGPQALAGAGPWIYFVIIPLSALYLDFRLSVLAGALAAGQYLGFVLYFIPGMQPIPGFEVVSSLAASIFKTGCLFLTGVASGFVAQQIRNQLNATLATVAERNRAVSIFGQHVSPQVAELLLHQPVEPAGDNQNVCIMFLDIRDFSRFAGAHPPAEVMNYLNVIFGELILAVNRHGGIVNKFLGDGFMAVFGAPVASRDQCSEAVAASKECLAIVDQLVNEGRIAPTRLGIGLHSGEAVTGIVGSSERKEYTIIGDVVNLASRIEQATKQFGCQLLASEQVVVQLNAQEHPAADLGLVELKGQAKPTHLFRLV